MGLINYFRDTKGEMSHVSWPTKNQTVIYTVLVILISIFIATYIGFFDWVFAEIIRLITV